MNKQSYANSVCAIWKICVCNVQILCVEMFNILGPFFPLFLCPSVTAGQPFLSFRCFPLGCRGQASFPYSRLGMSFTHRRWNIWIPSWHMSYIRDIPAQEISPFSLMHLSVFAYTPDIILFPEKAGRREMGCPKVN